MVKRYTCQVPLFLPAATISHARSTGWLIVNCLAVTLLLTLGLGYVPARAQPGRAAADSGRAGTPQPSPRRGRNVPTAPTQTPEQRKAIADSLRAARAAALQERQDSLRAVKNANRRPTLRLIDRYATRFSERTPQSPYRLRDPKSLGTDFRMLPDRTVTVNERLAPRPGVAPRTSPTTNPDVIATAPSPGATGNTSAPGSATNTAGTSRPPGLPYRPGEAIPFSEFNRLQNQRIEDRLMREYAARRDGQSAVSGRGLIPKLEMPPMLDRIFGGNNIDFKPNGFVALDLGYQRQVNLDPQTPVERRDFGGIIFNEQINVNFNGQIGERLGLLANFDTKASFNFENALKVNYRPQGLLGNVPGLGGNGLPQLPQVPGLPNLPAFGSIQPNPQMPFTPQNESILQNVELGNLTWNLNSQLIPGVQNLFGLKLQTRFGKLNVTTVASQQRSRKQEIVMRGGASNRPFEVRADQYDENRHFFLSQFFRNNYERSLKSLPVVTSGVIITRLEVYVTNRTNTTDQLRNVVGFTDLAEPNPFNAARVGNGVGGQNPADNNANPLFGRLQRDPNIRLADRTANTLETELGLQKGTDYDLLRGAKRLTEREYRFHPELGYVSLITPLKNDEVLAVSYEYTYQGKRYQVGELTENYQSGETQPTPPGPPISGTVTSGTGTSGISNRPEDRMIFLKLLKSSTIRNNLQNPMWNLMMKNVYSLSRSNATNPNNVISAINIARQGFQLRVVYKDDVTGIDNPTLQDVLVGQQLVSVFNLDKLNQQLDFQPDGNFDYVEGVTIDSRNGVVYFPVLEPFGNFLAQRIAASRDADGRVPELQSKYVFNELYRTTFADAAQIAQKNKFFLRGSFQSAMGGGTDLPYGVKPESVQVTAGGVPLVPGQDFVVEGQRLRILNESVGNSGREIRISFEVPDLFQNQVRTLLGARLDYRLSPEINIGATVMNMRETPAGFLTRVAIGNEPVNNTMLGFDVNLRRDSPGLTRLLDRLPMIQTKELSSIQFTGEVAQFLPGLAPQVNNNAFIDDFEATRTIFDLTRQPTRWKVGATPRTGDPRLDQLWRGASGTLESGYRRARISAYVVDQSIYLNNANNTSTNLTQAEKENIFEKLFLPNELFPGRSPRQIQLPETILDVAYFPQERGMYNYNPRLTNSGLLDNDPRQNFGAITRAITSDADFDNANIENITFWMMNPFSGTDNQVRSYPPNAPLSLSNTVAGSGTLHFNLGDVSEDFIPDGRYNFENGLPIDSTNLRLNGGVVESVWGNAPRQQFITNAFTNQLNARQRQDVGFDGLNNEGERAKFKSVFLDRLPTGLNAEVRRQIEADPSNDDFRFYLGPQADSVRYVVARYKQFMGLENNSPEVNDVSNVATPTSTVLPDIEDLNVDNTINAEESYYDYKIDIRPETFAVGRQYVIDKVTSNGADWYLFRVPVREFTKQVGSINGFKSLRFMRMYLTGFEKPVVLRFAQLQMEANQYRRATVDLRRVGSYPILDDRGEFKVSAVNIEENSQTQGGTRKFKYDVPPGFIRDVDYTQPNNNVELNEQSMALTVTDLPANDARGAFRNTTFDFLFRERLKMFVHMHNTENTLTNGVSTFLRIGTDYTDNYYEIEIPNLKQTFDGEQPADAIWPAQNELDIAFSELTDLKAARNKQYTRRFEQPYTQRSQNPGPGGQYYNLTVVGNPDLSSVQSVMIGVRNGTRTPRTPGAPPVDSTGLSKSFVVWVNEMRASGVNQTPGNAAVGALNLRLADVATVTASGRYMSAGFGGVQTKTQERTREQSTEYGLTAAIALDKFLPNNWGLKIPVYLNYDARLVTPQFDPLDPDMPLEQSLANLPEGSPITAAEYRRLVQDNTFRRGINFSNVRKVRLDGAGTPRFWDIENFGFNYAYNDIQRSNILTGQYLQEQYRGGFVYNFTSQPKPFEPFRNVKGLERKYLYWLKDFNLTLLPSVVSIRTDIDRSFIKTQLRNADLSTTGIPAQFEKYFLFNRFYDLTWNLTKNLVVTYRAAANAIIDEPFGEINTEVKRDSVWRNLRALGRMKNFQQTINTTYRVPFDKFPVLNWMTADVAYNVGYQYQANSFGIKDSLLVDFGNTIRNNREIGINGRVDLVLLYNKIKSLRWANTPNPPRLNFARNPGSIQEINPGGNRLTKAFVRALLTVRGINVSYTIQENTILPGFLSAPRFFGLDRAGEPGLGFVLGDQERGIARRLADQGLLSKSIVQNAPFTQAITRRFNATTTLEPFRDFRMNVTANYNRSDSYQEVYKPSETGGPYRSQTPQRTGSYSMSYFSFGTSFVGLRPDNTSPIFDRFDSYRDIILQRLIKDNPAGQILPPSENPLANPFNTAYNKNSQDVLIPAFFAAYSGADPNTVKYSPFYGLPFPNWDINYSGLNRVKPFSKLFTSFNLVHRYTSTYSVGDFVSSLSYEAQFVNLSVSGYPLASQLSTLDPINPATSANFIPVFTMSTITMDEQFRPLIGVRFQTKSRWTGSFEYNRSRNAALNIKNAMVADLTNRGVTAALGFTKKNVKLPFRINGQIRRLKNDLNFNMAVTFSDIRHIQRELGGQQQMTRGNLMLQIDPQLNYVVNRRLSMNLYFQRLINDPLATTDGFYRSTSAGGVRVRFNLAE